MNSSFDLAQVRAETPECTEKIHFNNAGAAMLPRVVLNSVLEYLKEENQIGGYEVQARRAEEFAQFYQEAAQLIGAKPEQIAFTPSAAVAWQVAFNGLKLQQGDRVLTSAAEYSVGYMSMLRAQQKIGIEIEVIREDDLGQICLQSLLEAIDDRVKVICLTHVPTSNGLINPAREVGKIAKQYEIPFFLDTCQSLGQLDVDVEALNCDVVCATGRKYLRGPRGTGFLYLSDQMLQEVEPTFIGLTSAEWVDINKYQWRKGARRYETFERSYAAMMGFKEALRYLRKMPQQEIHQRIAFLAAQLREKLSDVKGVKVTDRGQQKSGIVTFVKRGFNAVDIQKQLFEQNINVAAAQAQYARLDLDPQGLSAVVRASVHYYNCEEEINKFVEVIDRLKKRG